MKKNYYITLLFSIFLFINLISCHDGNANNQESSGKAIDSTSELQSKSSDDLNFLRDFNGKYPYEIKLFGNEILVRRLEALLGDRFEFMKKTWAVENPIEVKDEYFIATGCEAHNCASTNFIIVANLNSNKIYVGIREEEKVKKYAEQGGTFPEQIENWEKNN
jgi:hypothetical protein